MAKYLDLGGLSALWAKIKAALSKKQDALENAGDKSTPVYISGGKAVPVDFVDSPSVGTGTNPVNGGRYFYAVNDHTHANKSVLDGITAAKVAAWDEAGGDDWYELSSGSATRECFYIGHSDDIVGADQICCGTFLVYLKTLNTSGLYAVNFHNRYSSAAPRFTVRRLDGTADQGFGIYPVGMSSAPVYRYGIYMCFDKSNYSVVRVKPIYLVQFTIGVDWVTDSATIATVRANNGKADANPVMFSALPRAIRLSSGGSNISATGGTWTSSWLAYQSFVFGGGLDITVDFDLNLIGQSTYVATLAAAQVSLCDWAGTERYQNTVTMPRVTSGKYTVSKRCSVRFAIGDVGDTFREGFKIKVTLPSNYPLDAGAQVNVGGLTVNGINF